jgi:hypothetical protein
MQNGPRVSSPDRGFAAHKMLWCGQLARLGGDRKMWFSGFWPKVLPPPPPSRWSPPPEKGRNPNI